MLLVVVHSPSFATALAHLLSPRHRVVVASTTRRALQLLDERDIEAVVADLDLDPIDRGEIHRVLSKPTTVAELLDAVAA